MITAGAARRKALACFEGINKRDIDLAVSSFTDDVVFEFVGAGPDEKTLRGKQAIIDNFIGWWNVSPEIVIETTGVTVDSSWPSRRKEVALEWDQRATDAAGTRWRRRGVTVFVVTSAGAVACRDYLSELFDPEPAE